MNTMPTLFYLVAGLLIRLAVPIAATVLVIYILRRLDKRWQAEAERETVAVEKTKCWDIKGCSPEQIENCQAAKSSLPCWQAKRQPNGYLNESCLTCPVFVEAPIPALTIEPRSL